MSDASEPAPAGLEQSVVAGLPVRGYKAVQAVWKVDLVNQFKVLEELVLRQTDKMKESEHFDQRFLAIGITQAQLAFMAINRSIFQPDRLDLQDDAANTFQPAPAGPPAESAADPAQAATSLRRR